MTDEISSLLGKLTSGELTPVEFEKKSVSYVPSHQMNIPQLEQLIHNLSSKNQDTKGLKRQLMTLYHRAKDLDKTEKLLEDLSKTDFVFTSGLYAQLIDLYAYHDKLDKALEYYEKLREKEGSNFALDEGKIIRLAQLFIKCGRFEEGIKILEDTPRDRKQEERNFSYASLVWRFLNSLAEEGSVDKLNQVFDVLLKKEFIDVNNVLLGPLIKVHLVRNELDAALEKFEWCVNQFKATPWKNELACKLIQAEDAEKLQKLTDLSTAVHGEVNSLYDLVFAFVECGRIRQARKILETPGLQNRPQRINTACERYQQEGLTKPLEGLKDATKDLYHIDRSDIYYQLLLTYIKQDEDEKALGLWTQLQEEDLAATDQFLLTLGNYLKQKGVRVPFVMPEESQVPNVRVLETERRQGPSLAIFRQKLKSGDVDGALEIKRKSKERFNITDLSTLIEKLLQSDRVNEATDTAINILKNGNLPVNRVFRFLLNKLASTGDVESLNKIGSLINQDVKRMVSFDNRICHANLVAGKAEEYLNKLERDIDNCTEEDVIGISEHFPRGGAYGILERHPELIQQYENIAIKYATKGVVAPLNVLWTHYFVNENTDKAEQIWNTYLKDSPRIMFQKIVQTARDKQDENLAKKLIQHLKISNVTEGAIGNAYSCLLDVLVGKEKIEEAVDTFESAIKDVNIETINRTAVLRIKEIYEKLEKPFNYPIPPRNAKSLQEPNQN
ncbi:hypothetical protein NQ315_002060 [Exocentrus adspersus]|uniref:Uncharacterized protein n=1 Tax=Exocentrus adspersus TaxID=1586481 RepID=A0AAV8VFR4_9CUCU|nr:hypothetical protein NQ315_002060 [Exocentrus adspersus]